MYLKEQKEKLKPKAENNKNWSTDKWNGQQGKKNHETKSDFFQKTDKIDNSLARLRKKNRLK